MLLKAQYRAIPVFYMVTIHLEYHPKFAIIIENESINLD